MVVQVETTYKFGQALNWLSMSFERDFLKLESSEWDNSPETSLAALHNHSPFISGFMQFVTYVAIYLAGKNHLIYCSWGNCFR